MGWFRMGFRGEWVELIMKCVSTVTYRVKVNSGLSESFEPERGLRQGDPIPVSVSPLCRGFQCFVD